MEDFRSLYVGVLDNLKALAIFVYYTVGVQIYSVCVK